MPDFFTHAIAAQMIYDRSQKRVRDAVADRRLYALGAQGGDPFFMYDLRRRGNLGRRLHSADAAKTLQTLKAGNLSYAAGFAAHYALDSALHPAVCTFAKSARTPFAHILFEQDIGLYVSRLYGIPRRILPREEVCGATFAVYDAVRLLDDKITLNGVERCLKRFFAYTRAAYARKRQTYRFDYDYSSLAPLIAEAIESGVKCVAAAADGDFDGGLFAADFFGTLPAE